jgi:hypothetical protein
MKHSEWHQPRLNEFWRFVAERHNVFIRRVVKKQPPPWTEDEALAGAHYTNVYRELDRVTRDLITRVLEPTKHWDPADRLFQVLLYRAFNLPETYDIIAINTGVKRVWQREKVQRVLLARHKAGMKIFTGAFLVNGLQGTGRGGQARWSQPGGKIRLWVDRLSRIHRTRHQLMVQLAEAEGVREREDPRQGWLRAHAALKALPGFGDFLAYEVLVDLCYEPRVLKFTEDDWVNVGPGAKKGLLFMLKRQPAVWEVPLTYLRAHQAQYQEAAGVQLQGPALTLRNVEHVLCEYSKYRRMKMEIRPKRTYQLTRTNPDLTPWANLPERYFTTSGV